MTRRKMFFRMITASILRRRSRMLVALLAIAVGATILSGLVTIYYDVPRQMGAQFRNYGANMLLMASSNEANFTLDAVDESVALIDSGDLVGVAPYRYETLRIHDQQPVQAAGTDLAGARATSPYWNVVGRWPEAKYEVLLGRDLADRFALGEGDTFDVTFSGAESESDPLDLGKDLKVVGILETGGSEEEYLYMSMEDLEDFTGDSGRLDVVELSVSATSEKLSTYAETISSRVPDVSARLVKRVTQSESTVLTKLQSLVFIVTAVVLVLTMICVATTMTAVVTERRREIGLRKALGASDGGIIGEFMGEGLLLGGIGGVVGAALGFGFAQLVSVNVFASSITFQPLILIVTILVSVLVTGLACLIPVRSATDIDPALVLKGE